MCETNQKNMKRAMELREELFDLANSFAGEKYGDVAGYLHHSCNEILYAERMLSSLDNTYVKYYSE